MRNHFHGGRFVPGPPPPPSLIAPVNSSLPIIAGSAVKGQTLSVSTGAWLNSPITFDYDWKRGGVSIGSTGSSYTLVDADIGSIITCTVTATNTIGSAAATSAATSAVIDLAPANAAVPVLSGTPTVGQVLSVTNGTWVNTPTSYSYVWKNSGTPIVGAANANTYTLTSTENGGNITCAVTASNSGGGTSATSNSLGPVGSVSSPVLSSASASQTGPQTASLSVTTDTGNGTLYWTVDTSATTPTVAQIVAGQNASGGAATTSGSQAISATGAQSASAVGLSPSTTYYAHFVQKNVSLVASNAISSASFATPAFATPTLTNFSALGTAPLVLSWSDTDYTVGLYGQLQIATDSGFSAITQNIVFFIDGDSWARLDEAIGLTAPSGLYYARIRTARDNESGATTVSGTDPSGAAISFLADVSGWSTTFTDTITSFTYWNTTNGVNKNQNLTVSGTPALTIVGTAGFNGAPCGVRTIVAATGKHQFEVTISTLTGSNPNYIGIEDGTVAIGASVFPNPPASFTGYRTDGIIYKNGSIVTGVATVTTGDVVTIEFDTAAQNLSVYKNGTQLGSTQTSVTASAYYGYASLEDASTFLANFGQNSWTHALNTGYSGW